MKLVANIRLMPTPEQATQLRATLERCNEACNWLSEQAFAAQTTRQYDMHKAFYRQMRERFGLTAQVAVRCIAKVADSYKVDQKVQRVFRRHAAQPYDDRILSFKPNDVVSLWLISGRTKISYTCGEYQRRLLAHRKGEVDLMLVRGKWYLAVVCNFDDPALLTPGGMLGVDFGIVNIATDSLGKQHSGAKMEAHRERYAKRRAALQRVGTRAAKRRLRALSGRQKRFHRHENHCISKSIVSAAERSGLGIALEDLTHIRARAKANKEQRKRLHNWSFGQLRQFVQYKAKQAGVLCVAVDPAYTSQECGACGCIDKRNRKSQAKFLCVGCGHGNNADHNAAGNISRRATATKPMFEHSCVPSALKSSVL